MTIHDAFQGLVGAPGLFAVRSRGPIVHLTDRQGMFDIRSGKPRRYVPKFSDLVAIDWQVVTLEQLRKLMEHRAPKTKG